MNGDAEIEELEVHWDANGSHAFSSGYILCATVACFFVAFVGIALLVWLFRSKRRP